MKRIKKKYRRKLSLAYSEPIYEISKSRILGIKDELEKINISAARSLAEGLEDTLTIHRLGLYEQIGRSFTTTNTIENLNSQVAKYLRKVKKLAERRYESQMACNSATRN